MTIDPKFHTRRSYRGALDREIDDTALASKLYRDGLFDHVVIEAALTRRAARLRDAMIPARQGTMMADAARIRREQRIVSIDDIPRALDTDRQRRLAAIDADVPMFGPPADQYTQRRQEPRQARYSAPGPPHFITEETAHKYRKSGPSSVEPRARARRAGGGSAFWSENRDFFVHVWRLLRGRTP